MVRKRATKKGGAKGPRRPSKDDARVANWNTAADIPMEDEDEFHTSRDQILLEGEDDDDDDLGQGDEVFGLQGLSEDSEDDADEEEYADIDDEDESLAPSKPQKKAKGKKGSKAAAPSSSSGASDSEEEEETWGRGKKAYYASNADEIDSEDEEAREMEEQEARRLQGKALEGMTDADFGLEDDAVGGDADAGENEDFGVADAVAPALPSSADPAVLVRHLEKTNPEALALARDWEDTAYSLAKTKQNLERMETVGETLGLGMMHLYYQTLLTYASTLAFYLHLRATPKYSTKPDLLQSHPIFSRLLTLKQALATLEELDFAPMDSDEEDELDDGEEDSLVDGGFSDEGSLLDDSDGMDVEGEALSDEEADGGDAKPVARKRRVDFAELSDLLAEAEAANSGKPFTFDVTSSVVKNADAKKPSAATPATDKPPKKKRKTAAAKAAPVFDLVEPEFEPSSKAAASEAPDDAADAYGEPVALQHADEADKRARKRSLRFYTARIESKSAKREGARQAAMGGDDDIPYRERRKERETREAREAAKRALGQGGEDLAADGEGGDEDADAMDVDEGPADDGYYDLVKRASKSKKAAKKAAHDADVAAAREALMGDDDDAASGPRAPTRAILANKGLTPKRAKAVRNPRVKKRMRFEKAQRKVASQRAVYKGGLAATGGRYEGEKSGISKVVKSVKLS
ncbi:Sas10 C-terminal domain-containing protein [Schizophyllum fasciatum]